MVREVFNRDRYAVSRALTAIRDNDICGFSNMPSNVFRASVHDRQEELWPRSVANIEVSLLSHLGHKYPDYSFFVETNSRYFDRDKRYHETMRRTYVFKGEEPLGLIEIGEMHSNNTYGVAFTNARIANDSRRGEFKKTSKLNVAKSIFAKYFYGLTMLENMEAIAGDVAYEVDNAIHSMRHDCTKAEHKLLSFLRKEVEQNNQLVMTCIETLGEASLIDSYRAAKEAVTAAGDLGKLIADQKGHYVMLKDDEYISWHKGNSAALNQPKRHKREEMPDNMRMALGLLKLAEVNTFVHGAGFKAAENKFFILNEVQIEFDN